MMSILMSHMTVIKIGWKHFEDFWWRSPVTSQLTSLCVNPIESSFFVKLETAYIVFFIQDIFVIIWLESNVFHLVVDVFGEFGEYIHWMCEGRKIYTRGCWGWIPGTQNEWFWVFVNEWFRKKVVFVILVKFAHS